MVLVSWLQHVTQVLLLLLPVSPTCPVSRCCSLQGVLISKLCLAGCRRLWLLRISVLHSTTCSSFLLVLADDLLK
jgi:hypothetical protein